MGLRVSQSTTREVREARDPVGAAWRAMCLVMVGVPWSAALATERRETPAKKREVSILRRRREKMKTKRQLRADRNNTRRAQLEQARAR